jgi:hypothetical protein
VCKLAVCMYKLLNFKPVEEKKVLIN